VGETALQTPRSVKKEQGVEVPKLLEQRAFCDKDHGEPGCPPEVHGGPRLSRDPPVAHGKDPTPEHVEA